MEECNCDHCQGQKSQYREVMSRGMLHVFHTLDDHTHNQKTIAHTLDSILALLQERSKSNVVYVVMRMDDSDTGEFWEVYDTKEGAENEILHQKQQKGEYHEFRMYVSQVLKGE